MIKDEKSKTIFEVEGAVTALLPAAEFRVKLDNEHEICLLYTSPSPRD